MSIGERLKHARKRAHLKQGDVADRTQIGTSSISDFELGKRPPSVSQLQALATLYGRPMEFFFLEDETADQPVMWREQPESPERERIEDLFLRLCEQYANLEAWTGDHKRPVLPEAEGEADAYGYRHAEQLAYDVHQKLALGDRPGRSLLTVLEEVCGLKIFHLPFEPTGTAACAACESFGPAVLLNARNVRWRRNFDLAHELFHLLTWTVFRKANGIPVRPDDWEEKLATCFASNLLMPNQVTRLAIQDRIQNDMITFEDMSDIARQFDVSVDALCWRMSFLRFFTADQVPGVIERYRQVAPPRVDDRESDELPRRPARFEALARKAIRRGEISTGRFAEYLGVSRREALRFVEQEALGDEEVQVSAA